jgi:hypothetical protein
MNLPIFDDFDEVCCVNSVCKPRPLNHAVLGMILLVDNTDDWVGSDGDDGDVQRFGVESETESDSQIIEDSVQIFRD